MKPIEFDGVNAIYGKDQEGVQPLPAMKNDDGAVITCWELSPADLKKIAETGKIWLSQLTFNHFLQPILPSAYELQFNPNTGGTTYKEYPKCEHDFSKGDHCSNCHLALQTCQICGSKHLELYICDICEKSVCEACTPPVTLTPRFECDVCNDCAQDARSFHQD